MTDKLKAIKIVHRDNPERKLQYYYIDANTGEKLSAADLPNYVVLTRGTENLWQGNEPPEGDLEEVEKNKANEKAAEDAQKNALPPAEDPYLRRGGDASDWNEAWRNNLQQDPTGESAGFLNIDGLGYIGDTWAERIISAGVKIVSAAINPILGIGVALGIRAHNTRVLRQAAERFGIDINNYMDTNFLGMEKLDQKNLRAAVEAEAAKRGVDPYNGLPSDPSDDVTVSQMAEKEVEEAVQNGTLTPLEAEILAEGELPQPGEQVGTPDGTPATPASLPAGDEDSSVVDTGVDDQQVFDAGIINGVEVTFGMGPKRPNPPNANYVGRIARMAAAAGADKMHIFSGTGTGDEENHKYVNVNGKPVSAAAFDVQFSKGGVPIAPDNPETRSNWLAIMGQAVVAGESIGQGGYNDAGYMGTQKGRGYPSGATHFHNTEINAQMGIKVSGFRAWSDGSSRKGYASGPRADQRSNDAAAVAAVAGQIARDIASGNAPPGLPEGITAQEAAKNVVGFNKDVTNFMTPNQKENYRFRTASKLGAPESQNAVEQVRTGGQTGKSTFAGGGETEGDWASTGDPIPADTEYAENVPETPSGSQPTPESSVNVKASIQGPPPALKEKLQNAGVLNDASVQKALGEVSGDIASDPEARADMMQVLGVAYTRAAVYGKDVNKVFEGSTAIKAVSAGTGMNTPENVEATKAIGELARQGKLPQAVYGTAYATPNKFGGLNTRYSRVVKNPSQISNTHHVGYYVDPVNPSQLSGMNIGGETNVPPQLGLTQVNPQLATQLGQEKAEQMGIPTPTPSPIGDQSFNSTIGGPAKFPSTSAVKQELAKVAFASGLPREVNITAPNRENQPFMERQSKEQQLFWGVPPAYQSDDLKRDMEELQRLERESKAARQRPRLQIPQGWDPFGGKPVEPSGTTSAESAEQGGWGTASRGEYDGAQDRAQGEFGGTDTNVEAQADALDKLQQAEIENTRKLNDALERSVDRVEDSSGTPQNIGAPAPETPNVEIGTQYRSDATAPKPSTDLSDVTFAPGPAISKDLTDFSVDDARAARTRDRTRKPSVDDAMEISTLSAEDLEREVGKEAYDRLAAATGFDNRQVDLRDFQAQVPTAPGQIRSVDQGHFGNINKSFNMPGPMTRAGLDPVTGTTVGNIFSPDVSTIGITNAVTGPTAGGFAMGPNAIQDRAYSTSPVGTAISSDAFRDGITAVSPDGAVRSRPGLTGIQDSFASAPNSPSSITGFRDPDTVQQSYSYAGMGEDPWGGIDPATTYGPESPLRTISTAPQSVAMTNDLADRMGIAGFGETAAVQSQQQADALAAEVDALNQTFGAYNDLAEARGQFGLMDAMTGLSLTDVAPAPAPSFTDISVPTPTPAPRVTSFNMSTPRTSGGLTADVNKPISSPTTTFSSGVSVTRNPDGSYTSSANRDTYSGSISGFASRPGSGFGTTQQSNQNQHGYGGNPVSGTNSQGRSWGGGDSSGSSSSGGSSSGGSSSSSSSGGGSSSSGSSGGNTGSVGDREGRGFG